MTSYESNEYGSSTQNITTNVKVASSAAGHTAQAALNQSLESYKHKCAKEVLLGWLRSSAADVGLDAYCKAFGLAWRINRSGSDWGVFDEYPIADEVASGTLVHAWDETWWCGVPTYEDLCIENDPPAAILDIAIQEKGIVVYGFEVTHTNPVTSKKARVLSGRWLNVYEIEAEWILRQVCQLDRLKVVGQYGRVA